MTIGELGRGGVAARLRAGGLAWQVGPFRVRIRTDLADIASGLALLYRDFPTLDEDDAIVDVDVVVRRVGIFRRHVSIWVDGEPVYVRVPERLATPMLEWTLNVTVFQRPHQYLMLHAAVLERDGHALLLCGRAGSGKSTLCAALAHRGWRLLSDEVAVIRPGDGRVVPVPRPISLKGASIDIIRDFAPEATLGPTWERTIKGTVSHVLPPRESVDRSAESASPAWLVFPRHDPDTAGVFAPLAKSRALMAAADNAFNYSVLGARGFAALADAVDRCRCAELRFADLDQAIPPLDGLDPEAHASAGADRP